MGKKAHIGVGIKLSIMLYSISIYHLLFSVESVVVLPLSFMTSLCLLSFFHGQSSKRLSILTFSKNQLWLLDFLCFSVFCFIDLFSDTYYFLLFTLGLICFSFTSFFGQTLKLLILDIFFLIQLTLEHHRFELCGSTYMQIFFQ